MITITETEAVPRQALRAKAVPRPAPAPAQQIGPRSACGSHIASWLLSSLNTADSGGGRGLKNRQLFRAWNVLRLGWERQCLSVPDLVVAVPGRQIAQHHRCVPARRGLICQTLGRVRTAALKGGYPPDERGRGEAIRLPVVRGRVIMPACPTVGHGAGTGAG